jgi:hypothetical protein
MKTYLNNPIILTYRDILEVKVRSPSKPFVNIFLNQEKSLQLMLQIHRLMLSVLLNPPIDQYPKQRIFISIKINESFTLFNLISIEESFGNKSSSPA